MVHTFRGGIAVAAALGTAAVGLIAGPAQAAVGKAPFVNAAGETNGCIARLSEPVIGLVSNHYPDSPLAVWTVVKWDCPESANVHRLRGGLSVLETQSDGSRAVISDGSSGAGTSAEPLLGFWYRTNVSCKLLGPGTHDLRLRLTLKAKESVDSTPYRALVTRDVTITCPAG